VKLAFSAEKIELETTVKDMPSQLQRPTCRRRLFDVYITNFPQSMQSMDESKLQELLETISGVSCVRLTVKGTFCFFQVQGQNDYEQALEKLSGAEVGGKRLQAQKAKGRRGCTVKQTRLAETLHLLAMHNGITPLLETSQFFLLERALRTLYVGNVPPEATESDLHEAFEVIGRIEQTILIQDGDTQSHCGYGFVIFETHENCEQAVLSTKPVVLLEQQVGVQPSRPSQAIISIAHSAGLVDIDCNATPLLTSLLQGAKRQVSQKLGSFQQKHVYLQHPTTGVVYVAPKEQAARYIQSGQLLPYNGAMMMQNTGGLMMQNSPMMMQNSPVMMQHVPAMQQVPAMMMQNTQLQNMVPMSNPNYSYPNNYAVKGLVPQGTSMGTSVQNSIVRSQSPASLQPSRALLQPSRSPIQPSRAPPQPSRAPLQPCARLQPSCAPFQQSRTPLQASTTHGKKRAAEEKSASSQIRKIRKTNSKPTIISTRSRFSSENKENSSINSLATGKTVPFANRAPFRNAPFSIQIRQS